MKLLKDLNRANAFTHLANITYLPRWGVFLLDLFVMTVAFCISMAIGGHIFLSANASCLLHWWQQLLMLAIIQTIGFWLFRTYAGILRFSTFVDIIKIAGAVTLTGIVMITINIISISNGNKLYFNSIIVTYVFVSIVLMATLRIAIKTIFEMLMQQSMRTPVLIYGVRSAGLAIAKMLQTTPEVKYRPVGFITDFPKDTQHSIQGLKVYRRDQNLIQTMKQEHIKHVIISPVKLKKINPSTDLSLFLDNGITILTTPYFTGISSDDESTIQPTDTPHIGSIESIRVEDLLKRPVININTDNIAQMTNRKVILITGAAGSIGSEIVRQISHYEPSLIVLFDIAESPLHDLSMDLRYEFPNQHYKFQIGDVRDMAMVEDIFREYKPDIVFHAAAYKHVPLMEEYPHQAVLANVLGTRNVADMAVKYEVDKFIMISTDKAVNPTNVMGSSKRIAETYVQALNHYVATLTPKRHTKFITTRFGNVLGSNGSVVPFFKKQIALGGPVTVTHPDIIRYFMTIPEASCLVLEAATLGNGGEIFCFDMGQPVKIADLAKNMIRLAGYVPGRDIKIEYTGLRPGEKLYEELLNQKETTLPTPNEKIKIAKVREADYQTLIPAIDDLIQEAHAGSIFPTVAKMKKLVPEFKSRNSVYEQLD